MKKWHTLFRIKNPGTEWMQKIWIFEPLSKKELAKRKNEGWKQSGNSKGETIGKGGSDETNKNGIVRHKRKTR